MSEHDPFCTGCEHDCPWRENPMGAPYCQTCDDHYEASDDVPTASERIRAARKDKFRPLTVGELVRTPSGSLGTVYALPKRAAHDIRCAASERERDMSPYTVRLERDGSFTTYRGHELDRHV